MTITELIDQLDPAEQGDAMHALMRELYPICRSITGDGVRETFAVLQKHAEIKLSEVPTGTPVYDWQVPREWNIRDAYVKNSAGERVIDFKQSNLHVVSYSTPIHETMSLDALRPHLHTLADQPDLVPYRASHYKESWGFCLAQRTLDALPDGDYEVCIDSTLKPGTLTYGECVIDGETDREVLVSCHVCHPSLCNDNLSGIVVATKLIQQIQQLKRRRYRYRFVFVPGTIGSITWLSRNESIVANIAHGLVLTCVGDRGSVTYKQSRQGDAGIDRAFAKALADKGDPYDIRPFSPYGYDERQYCSPGFDLPVGCMMRTPFGEFDEYHTSADNPDFVRPDALADSLVTCLRVFEIIEHNRTYTNLKPKGEPQLGKRGLYDTVGGESIKDYHMALLWVLNQSDGSNDLLAIAHKSGLSFRAVVEAAEALSKTDLLAEA